MSSNLAVPKTKKIMNNPDDSEIDDYEEQSFEVLFIPDDVAFAVLSDVPSAPLFLPLFLPLFTLNLKSAFSRGFSFRKLQIFVSQTTDFHQFRKLKSLISQTRDFHFANDRFPFRKLQISISQTTDFHFLSFHFVSQTTLSPIRVQKYQ